LVGQVRTGQLEAVRRIRLVDVHAGRLGVGPSRLQLLDAVFTELDLVTPWRVVVGRHPLSHSQDEQEGHFHSLRPTPRTGRGLGADTGVLVLIPGLIARIPRPSAAYLTFPRVSCTLRRQRMFPM